LIVVLGHTRCGAIEAVLEELQNPAAGLSENRHFFVDEIRLSVDQVMADGWGHDPDRLVAQVGRENVRRATEAVRHGSAIIERLVGQDDLAVVGAEYSLRSGVVEFF
jgi:carbonic anhydrase